MCEHCSSWAFDHGDFILDHHPDCPHANPKRELIEHIKRLVRGLECWASDEDGVHPEAWEAYAEVKARMGQPVEYDNHDQS